MTSTFTEKLDADWHAFWSSLPGRRDENHDKPGEQQPAPQPTFTPHPQTSQPVSSQQSQPEEPMLSDQLTALTALAARLDALGDDSVTKLETVKANPDGNRGFEAIAALSPAASAVVSALEALAQQVTE